MQASRIGLGVMRMDVLERKDAAAMVDAAREAGINFFDTADIYGFGVKVSHASSAKFGQAWHDAGVERSRILIQTKFGIVTDYAGEGAQYYDFSKQHLIESLNDELKALQTDYVDSVLLHRPDVLLHIDEVADAFGTLVRDGKVRHFGVSNMSPQFIERLQQGVGQKLEINQLQLSLMFSPMIDEEISLNRGEAASLERANDALAYCERQGITIQAWSPFQSGTQYGPFVGNEHFPELNAALSSMALKYDSNANAIAAAWILRHPGGIQVIAGTMNPTRLAEISAAGDVDLSRQDWYALYKTAGHRLP